MVTSLYTVFVKLNPSDKDYHKYLMVQNDSGVLLVNKGLFVLSYNTLEDFKGSIEYKDVRHIGDITL